MRLSGILLACALASLSSRRAGAEDSRAFDVDHLQLAVTSPEFLGLEGAGPMRSFSWQAQAAYRYTSAALVGDMFGGGSRMLVDARSLLDVGGGVVAWRRYGLGASVPVLLTQSGDGMPVGAAIGDVRLVGRLNAFEAGGFGGAVLMAVRLPTGDGTRFLGGGGLIIEPRLATQWSGSRLRAGINLGVRVREELSYSDLRVGNELFGVAAVGGRPLPWLDLFGEAHIDTALTSRIFEKSVTPVELIGGASGRLGGFAVTAAVGFGVVEGWGSPRMRVLAGVSYSPPAPPPPAPSFT